MPIQLEEERQPGLPVVKRTALGQKFFGAVVKVDQRDRRKLDDNGNLVTMVKDNGKARQELVVTTMVLPGTTAPVGLGDDEHVPEPEELVRFILKGQSFADWIQLKKDLDRPIQVGDIMTHVTDTAQMYDANGKPTGKEITTQEELLAVPRGRSVGVYGTLGLRAPKDGSEWTEKAEKAYYSLKESIPAEDSGHDEGDFPPEPPESDEPPF